MNKWLIFQILIQKSLNWAFDKSWVAEFKTFLAVTGLNCGNSVLQRSQRRKCIQCTSESLKLSLNASLLMEFKSISAN